MKSMFRTIFVALLAVLAVSAVGSASAQAAKACRHVEKETLLCVQTPEGLGEETLGEVPFTANATSNALFQFKNVGISMSCSTINDAGTFDATGKGNITVAGRTVEFAGCTIGVGGCAVSPFTFGKEAKQSGLSGETAELGGGAFTLDEFPAANGYTFGTIPMTGSGCPAYSFPIQSEGNKAKTGPVCTLLNAPEALVEHTVDCAGSASHLASPWGGGALGLEMSEKISLAGAYKGRKWSLWEQ